MTRQVALNIGNCNIHYRYYTYETFLSVQQRLGFRHVQLFGGTPHVWIDAYRADNGCELARKTKDFGLYIDAFTAETSSLRYALGREGDASLRTWDYLQRCIDFAAEAESPLFIFHANGYRLGVPEDQRRFHMHEDVLRLSRMVRASGLCPVLRPGNGDGTDLITSLADAKELVSSLGSEAPKLAVETAYAYALGETLAQWMQTFLTQIEYISLSNLRSDRNRGCFGDGQLSLSDLLESLPSYTGTIGFTSMSRFYQLHPWDADEKNMKMLSQVLAEEENP